MKTKLKKMVPGAAVEMTNWLPLPALASPVVKVTWYFFQAMPTPEIFPLAKTVALVLVLTMETVSGPVNPSAALA